METSTTTPRTSASPDPWPRRVSSILERRLSLRQLLFAAIGLLCLSSPVSAPLALLLGLLVALTIGHPFIHLSSRMTSRLLEFSIIGLGFGMDFHHAMASGRTGFMLSTGFILLTLALGLLLGSALGIDRKTSLLISSGTAICGGSAIAAIAPVIDVREHQMSVALGTVFVLNALALFIFPQVGVMLGLSQHQFGLWSAIAIHDTSSVVGSAASFGAEALETATTVKLARSLWIIPLAVFSSMHFGRKASAIRIPWFIVMFLVAMGVHTFFPASAPVTDYAVHAAHAGLTLTLFLVGSALAPGRMAQVGWKPFVQGGILWAVISIAALAAVVMVG
ncbi:putative sulfate exporter family transporter [Chlorobium sp. N1]|uniref:YeiH family protein n=1 Tax=Chlorobium sp. N1 TaxID=2491138 RepID=UPI00103E39CD|nr:putative sulfate exporter family transporter [Chlorobium sp. N1]TCD47216.1 putative sulfate exporter family transporter [Chlorobium sp. N1]